MIYDVYCQYGVHFEDRIEAASDYLHRDPQVKMLGAIGKFHLADHVDSCFSKWSLNFMKGAGHIDGEIMETLWSGMNKVSGAARSMSKAHRQETLDDYMRDSNWKKTVGISEFFNAKQILIFRLSLLVPTLLRKLKRSQIGLDSTRPAFEELTKACHQRKLPVDAWRSDEHLATEERGEFLKIFDINHQKSPTLAEITVQLCDDNDNSNGFVDIVQWIADGIQVENDQSVLDIIAH